MQQLINSKQRQIELSKGDNMNQYEEFKVTLKRLFDNKDGQQVIDFLSNKYYIDSTTFQKEIDKDKMIYREGQRSVMLFIKNLNR